MSQASIVPLEQPDTDITRPVNSSTQELSQALCEPSLPNASNMPADERVSPSLEKVDSMEEPGYRSNRDSVLMAAGSLQRKLSWGPADDQVFRVAQSQKPSSPTTSGSRTRRFPIAKQLCTKCEGVLTGQYVRALGGLYHLACFTCRVCFLLFSQSF
jgi:hypothetical protein